MKAAKSELQSKLYIFISSFLLICKSHAGRFGLSGANFWAPACISHF